MNPSGLQPRGEALPLRLHFAALAAAVVFFTLMVAGGGMSTGTAEPGLRWAPRGAAWLGLLGVTLVMAVGLQKRRRQHPNLVRAGWTAAGLVGGDILWTALTRSGFLPADLLPLKDAASLLLFLLLVYLAAGTAPATLRPASGSMVAVAVGARRLALVAGLVLTCQMAMGALVRYTMLSPHTGSATDVVYLHRLGSIVTLGLVMAATVAMYRATAHRPWLRGLALAVAALVIAQILIGTHSATAGLGAQSAQAHVGAGAALLAAHWGLYLASGTAGTAVSRSSVGFILRQVVALAKPRITFMVVVTFAGGLWLAPVAVSPAAWGLTLLGTVLIVAAANALNMYWERDVDGRMHRTRNRPLPTARITPEVALAVGTVLCCVAVPLLLVGSNALTAALGLLAFASYVFVYTPMKQISSLAVFVGAVPGALPPLMGWTAATGSIDSPGLLMFAILFAWQIPHFLAISMMRGEEYAGAGIKVMPIEFGLGATRWAALVFALLTLAASLGLFFTGVMGWPFALAALGLGVPFVLRSYMNARVRSTADVDAPETKAARLAWARRLFGYSIVYLCLLFAALGFDRGLGGY